MSSFRQCAHELCHGRTWRKHSQRLLATVCNMRCILDSIGLYQNFLIIKKCSKVFLSLFLLRDWTLCWNKESRYLENWLSVPLVRNFSLFGSMRIALFHKRHVCQGFFGMDSPWNVYLWTQLTTWCCLELCHSTFTGINCHQIQLLNNLVIT